MTRPEPQCIQWKRQGAERVAAQTFNMSREQELEFWRQKTERLRARQVLQREAEHLTPSEKADQALNS
jgi:hypothetical protein